MSFDSIPRRLFEQGRNRPEAPAFYAKSGGIYRPTRYREYAAVVRRAAKSLRALGVGPGKATCVLGFNRPEWVIFHVATMTAGAAAAGIYTSCSAEEVAYIVNHAEAPVVLVENQAQYDKLKRESDKVPLLQHIVLMSGAPKMERSSSSWSISTARRSRRESIDASRSMTTPPNRTRGWSCTACLRRNM